MKKGAMIQLTKTEKAICFHRAFWVNMTWRDSYLTLHRMGYIMTSKPMAA